MSPEPLSTFHYHACAHGFSARFTRPFEYQIDAQAASALPIIGGHGQARVENFQFREFLSFRKDRNRSEEHTSELQSRRDLVCRLLLEKKKKIHRLYSFKKKIL